MLSLACAERIVTQFAVLNHQNSSFLDIFTRLWALLSNCMRKSNGAIGDMIIEGRDELTYTEYFRSRTPFSL